MPNLINRTRIAERLLVLCDIEDRHLRAWKLAQKGYSGREVGNLLGYGKSTIYRWLNSVDDQINQVEAGEVAEGRALAGVTIHDGSNDETETPFQRDMCLVNLGF